MGKNGVRSNLTHLTELSRKAGPDLGGTHFPLHSAPPPPRQPFSKAQGVLKASEATLESPVSRRQTLPGVGK